MIQEITFPKNCFLCASASCLLLLFFFFCLFGEFKFPSDLFTDELFQIWGPWKEAELNSKIHHLSHGACISPNSFQVQYTFQKKGGKLSMLEQPFRNKLFKLQRQLGPLPEFWTSGFHCFRFPANLLLKSSGLSGWLRWGLPSLECLPEGRFELSDHGQCTEVYISFWPHISAISWTVKEAPAIKIHRETQLQDCFFSKTSVMHSFCLGSFSSLAHSFWTRVIKQAWCRPIIFTLKAINQDWLRKWRQLSKISYVTGVRFK